MAVLDTNTNTWHGKVIGYYLPDSTTCNISDVITFQSSDITQLKHEMSISVDEYLDMLINQ